VAPQKRVAFRRIAVGLAVLAGLIPAWTAQTRSEKEASEDASPARLLKVDVVALDSSGLPVRDLRVRSSSIRQRKRQTPVFVRPNHRSREQQVVLGPREYSNLGGPTRPPATVILFDLMNERVLTDEFGRIEIIQALQGLDQSEGLYLYILTNTGGILSIHPLASPEASA
jgi:hypothetical protein